MLVKDKQMGSESSGASSPFGKRGRDPEDEIYLDNLHSSKRYLSEIMASSLNGLTVEDGLSEGLYYTRDEVTSPYSPMSEDSDETRYCDTPPQVSTSHNDSVMSSVSPYRYPRSSAGVSSTGSATYYPSIACSLASVTCPQPRQRSSDSEGRFPSSPSDICHTGDLRRAALLRSVQMRVQPHSPPSLDMLCGTGHEHEPMQSVDGPEDEKGLAEEKKCNRVLQVLDECTPAKMSDSEVLKQTL